LLVRARIAPPIVGLDRVGGIKAASSDFQVPLFNPPLIPDRRLLKRLSVPFERREADRRNDPPIRKLRIPEM